MRLVFFGTPEFAVPSLRALLGEGFNVVAAVTQPDRSVGRSRSRRMAPPVKEAALEDGLTVLQPEDPNTPDSIEEIRALAPDLGIVVAYGHILKPELLAVPTRGMLNVHASLLPALRGAAPIQHAILNGASETGVSIMRMEKGMDSGPVLIQVPLPVYNDETAGELQPRLAEVGALALVEAMTMIELGAVEWMAQDHDAATYAPKITRETARIAWDRSAEDIGRLVRAMDPAPGAWSTLGARTVKFFGPTPTDRPADTEPGQIVSVDPTFVVAAATDALSFEEVQPEGKKRMSAPQWARGRGASVGRRFE